MVNLIQLSIKKANGKVIFLTVKWSQAGSENEIEDGRKKEGVA